MEYNKRYVQLRNGESCLLRSPTLEDAEAMIKHLKITSKETDFMSRYEEEINQTIDEQREKILDELSKQRCVSICAILNNKIVANGGIGEVRNNIKYLHRAWFGISIQKEYWGLGIGSCLLQSLLECAKLYGYKQVELDVVCENKRAIALYKKYGFKVYGTRPHSFKLKDGSYKDEYLMLCQLSSIL